MLAPVVHVLMELKEFQVTMCLVVCFAIKSSDKLVGSDVDCGNQSEHLVHHAPLPH